jgi:hypothetical protein
MASGCRTRRQRSTQGEAAAIDARMTPPTDDLFAC